MECDSAGDWIDAGIRETCTNQSKVSACDFDRALLEIQVENFFGTVLQYAEAEQQVSKGAVTMAGILFGPVHFFVDHWLSADVKRKSPQDPRQALSEISSLDGAAGSNSTRVDHGVTRTA